MATTVISSPLEELYQHEERLWKLEGPIGDAMWARCTPDPQFEYCGGKARFTGWKFGAGQRPGYVGQWLWTNAEGWHGDMPGSINLYVNLPGGEEGRFERGGTFDIGVKRFKGDESADVLRRAIVTGRERLKTIVDALPVR